MIVFMSNFLGDLGELSAESYTDDSSKLDSPDSPSPLFTSFGDFMPFKRVSFSLSIIKKYEFLHVAYYFDFENPLFQKDPYY